MTVYTLDPLRDTRWSDFVGRHDAASVFHSVPWLDAIHRTYGYTPVVYTTSPPSTPLVNGIVVCEIKSWLTGSRMVSLPFSDHCEPLLDGAGSTSALIEGMRHASASGRWKYVELRPESDLTHLDGVTKMPACYFHKLDLTPSPDEIFRRTQKTSIQQKVRRAEREGITCESGNSNDLLQKFYRLLLVTRRRHQLPPQPIEWFRNLIECMGDALTIRVAHYKGEALAAMLTILHKKVVVYKYGCSEERMKNLGIVPFLIWTSIVEAKAAGATVMDFGRSDADNPNLIAFKDRWGTTSSQLTYLRWSRGKPGQHTSGASAGVLKRLFAVMPDALLQTTGRILYRHVG